MIMRMIVIKGYYEEDGDIEDVDDEEKDAEDDCLDGYGDDGVDDDSIVLFMININLERTFS